jgi:demethoxyubiquinone hydroxylase (CLK1/Coq7/Cat5 family)
MESQQQQNDLHEEKPLVQIEGPNFSEEQWAISVSIGPNQKTFYGKTEEEAREQMEKHLDQQIAELEKFRTRLRNILSRPKKDPWPDSTDNWNNVMEQVNARIERERAERRAKEAKADENQFD